MKYYLTFIFLWFLLTGSTLDVGSWNCSKISGSGVYDSKCIGYVGGNLKVIYKGQTKNNKPSGKGILTIPDDPRDYLQGTWKNGTLINGVAFLSGEKIFFKNGKMTNKPSSKKKLNSVRDTRKNSSRGIGGIFGVIIWIAGGVAAFGLCATIMKTLESTFGGFSFVIVVVLWFIIMMFLAGIVDIPIGPDRGPAFFGDAN